MPDMDPHEAGPSIQTILSRQPMHRSSLLWDAPLEGEAMPGVLTCRHRDKGHSPPGRAVGDRRKNTAVIEGPRVKAKWLEDRFSNPLSSIVGCCLLQVL
nr:hypothetical protein CFP56_78996 [Quercus suber]